MIYREIAYVERIHIDMLGHDMLKVHYADGSAKVEHRDAWALLDFFKKYKTKADKIIDITTKDLIGDERMTRQKHWIAGAIKKPGALRKTLGVKKGEKIPAAKLNQAAKQKGVTGQRARLAKTLKTFKK